MYQPAGVRPQVDVGRVHHPQRARRRHRPGLHHQPGGGGAAGGPTGQRYPARSADQRGQLRHPAPGAAHDRVRRYYFPGGGSHRPRPTSAPRPPPHSPFICPRHWIQADHVPRGPGQHRGPVPGRHVRELADHALGDQIPLTGEPRDIGRRPRQPQRRLKLGRLPRADQAGRVPPAGQPPQPRGEQRAPGRAHRPLEVSGRPVPRGAAQGRRKPGPGLHPGVVEVVVGLGRLVVGVQPGEARPGGGAAGPVPLQQRHLGARLGQPGRHAHAEDPGADHDAPARPQLSAHLASIAPIWPRGPGCDQARAGARTGDVRGGAARRRAQPRPGLIIATSHAFPSFPAVIYPVCAHGTRENMIVVNQSS